MGQNMTAQISPISKKLYVGIDAGSVSVNSMVIDDRKQILYESPYARHWGKVEETVTALIRNIHERSGMRTSHPSLSRGTTVRTSAKDSGLFTSSRSSARSWELSTSGRT